MQVIKIPAEFSQLNRRSGVVVDWAKKSALVHEAAVSERKRSSFIRSNRSRARTEYRQTKNVNLFNGEKKTWEYCSLRDELEKRERERCRRLTGQGLSVGWNTKGGVLKVGGGGRVCSRWTKGEGTLGVKRKPPAVFLPAFGFETLEFPRVFSFRFFLINYRYWLVLDLTAERLWLQQSGEMEMTARNNRKREAKPSELTVHNLPRVVIKGVALRWKAKEKDFSISILWFPSFHLYTFVPSQSLFNFVYFYNSINKCHFLRNAFTNANFLTYIPDVKSWKYLGIWSVHCKKEDWLSRKLTVGRNGDGIERNVFIDKNHICVW